MTCACSFEHEIPLPESARTVRDPFRWVVTVSGRQKLGVIPDRVFALEFTASKERILCFLEADRGTMPVQRHRIDASSFGRKFAAYEETWRRGIHTLRFGNKRLRVLAVTDNEERATHLQHACVSAHAGHGIFLFSTRQRIADAADALVEPWSDARSETMPLAA